MSLETGAAGREKRGFPEVAFTSGRLRLPTSNEEKDSCGPEQLKNFREGRPQLQCLTVLGNHPLARYYTSKSGRYYQPIEFGTYRWQRGRGHG